MTNDHDPNVFRSLFSSARRHDASTTPDLDDLLARGPARTSSWIPRPGLLLGGACLVATVTLAATVLVFVPLREMPLPEPQPSSAVLSGYQAPPPPPPPLPGKDGVGAGTAGVEHMVAQTPGAHDRLTSLGYLRGVAGGAGSGVGEKSGLVEERRTYLAQKVAAGSPSSEPVPASGLGETVDVFAARLAANTSDSRSVRFSDEFLQDLPVQGRFYQNMLTMAPGVQDSDGDGNPNVHGARSMDFKTTAESNTERYAMVKENEFLASTESPLSTFSIDVDTASYSVVRRFLKQGQLPPANAVRIEELVNYFPYSYPQPTGTDPFSVNVEIASCPWAKTHRLARIGLHGREERRDAKASNLVFLIDVSGSMDSPAKLPLLKSALSLLVDQLGGNDQVAIVVYAGASGLALPSTPGSRASDIRAAIDVLGAGGSTNGGEGLKLAYKVAREHLVRGGVNRVILATDGDFNVGVTDRGELMRLVEENAKAGVALTTLGFGMGNYNDETLETLADHGNGNHFYIDDDREARKVLVEQVGGTLVTIAKDVKIQVEFNPGKVGAYRLVGYENRMLAKEDFNDDRKDAGEIGSGHDVTAIYELVPPGEALERPGVDPLKYQTATAAAAASDESFTVKLRYKDPDGDTSRLLSVPAIDSGAEISAASEDTRWSAAVAAFGMVLRGSSHRGTADLALCARLAASALGADPGGYRSELLSLLEKARTLQPR